MRAGLRRSLCTFIPACIFWLSAYCYRALQPIRAGESSPKFCAHRRFPNRPFRNNPRRICWYVRPVANQDLYSLLESLVCSEQIERFAGRTVNEASKHVDSITAKISMESGVERYSHLYRKNRPLRDMTNLEGAWSEGEFGTLLKQTEQLMRTQQPRFELWDQVNGALAGVYTFNVTVSESPWTLNVSGQRYALPFTTTVWISRDSGEILRIARLAANLPAGLHIDQITWGVTLDSVDLNGMHWLLPSRGEYQVSYRSRNRTEWNRMTFSDYHRYGSEIALHFN